MIVGFTDWEGIKLSSVCVSPSFLPRHWSSWGWNQLQIFSQHWLWTTSEVGFHSSLEGEKYPTKYTEWKRFSCEIVMLKTQWEGGGWGRTRIFGVYKKVSGPCHKCKARNDSFTLHSLMGKCPVQWKQQQIFDVHLQTIQKKHIWLSWFSYPKGYPTYFKWIRSEKKSSKRNQNICYSGVMKSFLPRAGTLPWFAFNSCSFSAWLTSAEINPKSTNVAPELSKKIIPLLPPSLSKHFKGKKPSCLCNCAQKKINKFFQIQRILSSCPSKPHPTFCSHFSFLQCWGGS